MVPIIEVILGCAVLGDSKSEYVAAMVQLDEETQKMLMNSIQKVLDCVSASEPSNGL